MKTTLLITAMLLAANASFSGNGNSAKTNRSPITENKKAKIEYHDDGTQKLYFEKKTGTYTLYYENGVTCEQGTWMGHYNTGSLIRNYPDGSPWQVLMLDENGKKHGPQRYYDQNGRIELDGLWNHGKLVWKNTELKSRDTLYVATQNSW